MILTEDIKTHLELADKLMAAGRVDEALEAYKRAEALDEQCWPAFSQHAHALCDIGRTADALHLVEHYVDAADAACGEALNDLGVIRCLTGETERSFAPFLDALKADPPPGFGAVALANLAYALYAYKRFDECLDVCRTALRLEPNEIRPHYILAVLEAKGSDSRVCRTTDVLCKEVSISIFPWLQFSGQKCVKHRVARSEYGDLHVQAVDSITQFTAQHWGALISFEDQTWCSVRVTPSRSASMTLMQLSDQLLLIQRRKWVRLPATGSISRLEVRKFPPGVEPFEVQKMLELNFSVEGAAVRTRPELPPQTAVSLFVTLEGLEPLEIQARVVRMGLTEVGGEYSALVFEGMDEKTRERIARAIHQLQLSRKQRTRSQPPE